MFRLPIKMIGNFQFLFVILVIGAAKGEILKAKDAQICKDLCTGCVGTASFDDGVCDCRVPENNEKNVECLKHLIKQQNENGALAAIFSDEDSANRDPRCSRLGSRQRFSSTGDMERVANYFINSGPLTGTPLVGSSNCDTSSKNYESESNLGRSANESHDNKVSSPKSSSVENHGEYKKIDSAESAPLSLKSPISLGHQHKSASPILGAHHSHHGLLQTTQNPEGLSGLLGALPELVVSIPQMLKLIPGMLGSHVPHPHLGRSRVNPLINTIATETQGIVQNVNDVMAAYVPARSHGHIVGAANPHLTEAFIPRYMPAQLSGQYIPAYHPGYLGATQYIPVLAPLSTEIHGHHAIDNLPTLRDSGISNSNVAGSQNAPSKPSEIHDFLLRQNAVLESLTKQLAGASSPHKIEFEKAEHSQTEQPIVSATNTVRMCPCPEDRITESSSKLSSVSSQTPRTRISGYSNNAMTTETSFKSNRD